MGVGGKQAEPHRCFQPWRTSPKLMLKPLSHMGISKQAGQAPPDCCHPSNLTVKGPTSIYLPPPIHWSLISLTTQPKDALSSPWRIATRQPTSKQHSPPPPCSLQVPWTPPAWLTALAAKMTVLGRHRQGPCLAAGVCLCWAAQ